MHYRGPKRRREREGPEKIFEEIIPNMGKEIATQIQEVQSPTQEKPRRNMPRHILIKITKTKYYEKILKQQGKKKTNNIQGNPHKVIS